MDKTLQLCWKSCTNNVKASKMTRFMEVYLVKLLKTGAKVQDFHIKMDF